jgi:hypothetical protein
VEGVIVRRRRIGDHNAVISPIIGFTDSGMDTDFRCNATDNYGFDLARLQYTIQVSRIKRAL